LAAVADCEFILFFFAFGEQIATMEVLAPAKINLSLKILDRRSDGFHEIESFITPISLFDEIRIDKREQGEGIEFHCDDPSLPQGQENLVLRAADLFFTTTKIEPSVSIKLKKMIPHGAGLGGGSSDAAATLLGLNKLFATKLRREALLRFASTIGSDLPFFVFTLPAICRGRGELVSPAKLKEQLSILLLKPDFGVSTEWAYSRWNDSREIPGFSYATQESRGQHFFNDLERPVFEKFVFLAEIKKWLLNQSEVGAALMSGSGSTIFAVLRNTQKANALAERAREELDPKLWIWAGETL
jgi:4-diphosphocytidyl-2-C-methyl-D-erythritol kinase